MEIVNYIKRVKQNALSYPDKVVIVDNNATRKTTNAELWALTEKIAAQIKSTSSVGKIIPIVLPDSMEYFAAEIAIWMTGNCAVNLGSSFPEDRVNYIMQVCEAEFMIDSAFIDKAKQLTEGCSDIYERQSCQPCVMFFTSGSTGNPKGVQHSDRGFIAKEMYGTVKMGYDKFSSFASIAPNYFVAIVGVFVRICLNVTVHILTKDIKTDPAKLMKYMEVNNIETAFISPSILQVISNSPSKLKIIFTGSERLVGCYSENYTLINCYGQTETAGTLMIKLIDKGYDNSPVGQPVPGIEVCLLDEQGNEVPDGELGELCIKSGFSTPQYFKDPVRTQDLTQGGVQHTGDLMKRLPNGDYLYVQRKDWMVKINGQRVEPGEIETVMKQMSGIKDAVVKGFTTEDLSRQYLVGYYILNPDSDLDSTKIEAELKKTLPAYMVPAYMVQMDSFPLNANFKVDRKNLKSPAITITTSQSEYVAPTNEVEKAICGIFASVLNLDKVGINDDFALLGGDSIRAMKVQQMFYEKYADRNWGVLSASIINLGHTPKKIAELLANAVDYVFEEMEDYPLTSEQLIHLLKNIEDPNSSTGILYGVYKLDESINLEKLATALEQVTIAHKAFGIQFIEKEPGVYRQKYVSDPVQIKPEKMDEKEFTQVLNSLCTPFAVFNNPLFRIRVIETTSGKYFMYSMHHAISDGTSNTVLLRDISLAYDGNPIPKEEWSQLEVSQMVEQFKQSDKYAIANKWFEEKLQDVPLSLPAQDVTSNTPQTANKMFVLQTTADELKFAAKKMDATLNVYTATVFARLMGKYSSQHRAAILLPYDSRDDYRTLNTIGMLVNRFVLNTSWDENTSLKKHLEQTNSYITTAMSYIHSDVKDKKLDSIAALFFQNEMNVPMIGGKVLVSIPIPMKKQLAPTPIFVHLFLDYSKNPKGIIIAYVFYYAHMYSESTIKNLMDDFSIMLKEV